MTTTPRFRILASEPRTLEEADALLSELARVTDTSPDPGPPHVLSYTATDNFSPAGLIPNLPCSGPPVPMVAGLLWPYEIRAQISILKGQPPPKEHRQQQVEISADELPHVTVHVFSRRMEGEFIKSLHNLTPDFDVPGGILTWWLEALAESIVAKLINVVATVSEAIPRGGTSRQLTPFEYSGGWTVIKAIWEFLVHRSVTVHLSADLSIPGYETVSFIIDRLDKHFETTATIPASRVEWSLF